MNVKQLVASNNERKKVLTTENMKYYDDLLVYIRLASMKEEYAKEEVLLELLEHLIEAQQNEKSAEEVFGKNAQQLADEIIDSLPAIQKKSIVPMMIEAILLLLGTYITSTGLFNLFLNEETTLYVGTVIIGLAALIGGFLLLLPFVLKQLRTSTMKHSKMPFVYATIAITVYIFAVGAIMTFMPAIGSSFTVTAIQMVIIGMVCLMSYFTMKQFKK